MLGVACYDADYRGAAPIAAISPAAARALLEALQPLAAGHDAIRVVVQHDPELNRTLAEAGSQVTLEFVHYRGTLLES